MKRLTTLTLIAMAAAAMIAIPIGAQPRSGSNSRGGSGGGNARSNGGSRPSTTMSAPSSQTRSAGQSGNTKGLGSVSRSQQQAAPSRNVQPTNPGGNQPSRQPARTGSNVNRGSSSGSGSNAAPAARQQERKDPPQNPGGGTVNRNQPGQGGTRGGTVNRNQPAPGGTRNGTVNRNQPGQPGMGMDRSAPRTVRPQAGTPRNFEGGREPGRIRMQPGPGRNIDRVPPRRREPMPLNHAVRFWDGGRHYFGYRVSYLPDRFVREVFWGVPYYILDGIYYRRYGDSYYISRPPFGVLFDPILDNLIYSVCNFAYYYDVYNTYRTVNDNARIIAEQNETIAANNARIAGQNEAIALNSERAAKSYKEANRLGLVQRYADAGEEYYYQDGVFFTKNAAGKYVTIVPPAGALVQELPDDYETITLDGEEYFKVDDTVYKLSIIDGSPYFEVLGQLTGELADKYDFYANF